jgi:histone deacetylase 6
MEIDSEDVQMTGISTDTAFVKAQDVEGVLPSQVPVTQIEVRVGNGTDDDNSFGGSNSPGPVQVSSLSLAPQSQSQSYQDTASDDDGTSESPVFPPMNGTQPIKNFLGVEIISQPATPNLPYASQRTGLVYDPRMRFHTELEIDEDEEIHPEDPRRIYEIYNDLVQAGLVVVEGQEVDERLIPYKLIRIPTREAEAGEICLVHSRKHYDWMTTLKSMPKEELVVMGKSMDSLYLHPLTFLCAKLSAGGAIEACRAVAAGRVRNAMAVIRPPGHHAEHDKPGGFCFFDNVAIAAKVCQKDFGESCRKILILDWDVHHGNGVQMAFEDDPNVLYISLHVHNNGKFYPSGDYGDHLHIGMGAGEGKNINIPWRTNGMTDGDYIYAFQHIVMPVAYEFNPDLVIISAGFDAADGDMLGGCHVTPAGYAHMTHMLMSLAGGKVVACLEGGYNLRAIARSALAVTRTLMGEPPDRLPGGIEASPGCVDICNLVIRTHAAYWQCLYPKQKVKNRLQEMGGERLHDLLRRAQAHEYATNYKMAELWIMRDKLSKSFDRQVLATQVPSRLVDSLADADSDGYIEAKPLLVIFHDPPETLGEQNTHTGAFDAHNIVVTDVAKQYLEWAVENKFGVIDVNMPKYVTSVEVSLFASFTLPYG